MRYCRPGCGARKTLKQKYKCYTIDVSTLNLPPNPLFLLCNQNPACAVLLCAKRRSLSINSNGHYNVSQNEFSHTSV